MTVAPDWLLDHAPYTPFMDARTVKPPGLSPLDMAEWTVRHADFDAQMRRRREVLRDAPDVAIGSLHEGEDPALELLSMLKAHLGLSSEITQLEEFCGWTTMAHLVAEDFCVLLPDAASGEYRLVGAILCFPSRWLLSEKLGRPLTIIHDPVPDYDDALARRVNRVFEAIDERRPMVRCNWLVHSDPELFLPLGQNEKQHLPRARAEGPVYLRTERQTLIRLPRSKAVVFGIKTSVTPAECLTPEQARGLYDAIGGEDDEVLKYRGGSAQDHARRVLAGIAGI